MRILLCMYDYFAGGAETQFRFLSDALQAAEDMELYILFEKLDHDHSGHAVEVLNAKNIQYYNLDIDRSISLLDRIALKLHYDSVGKRTERKLTTFLKKHGRLDWVITYNYTFIPFVDLFHQLNMKVLFSERNDGQWIQKINKINYGVKRADKVTCNSVAAMEYITDVIGVSCEYVKNGVQIKPENYKNAVNPRDSVLISARISPEKNQEIILKAMLEENMDFKLVLCGSISDETYYQKLSEMVQKNNLSDKVCFAGFQSDMIPYLHNAFCVVLPSYYEGTPNAILEAYALGTPALASKISMNIPLFEDSNLLFSPDDPESFIKAYRYLSEMSESDIKKLMERNFLFVQKEYSVLKMQDTYLSILRANLCRGGRKNKCEPKKV